MNFIYFSIGSLCANCVSRTHVRVRNNSHSFIIQMFEFYVFHKCINILNSLLFRSVCLDGCCDRRLQSHANHSNDKRILNGNTHSGTIVDVVFTVRLIGLVDVETFSTVHSSSNRGAFLSFNIRDSIKSIGER